MNNSNQKSKFHLVSNEVYTHKFKKNGKRCFLVPLATGQKLTNKERNHPLVKTEDGIVTRINRANIFKIKNNALLSE